MILNYEKVQRTDGSLSVALARELDNTSALGAAIGLVLNLSALDLADGGEEVDKILVAG